MRITDLYGAAAPGSGRPVISFEFFPPKTDKGFDALFRTIEELKHLDPGFVSVTMGAGGSTRRKTVELVTQIQRQIGITSMAHLPCVGFERGEIAALLDGLRDSGLENVLALGGDPPKDRPYTPPADGFEHANELVSFIRGGWDLCIGAACYPETHPAAPSPEADLQNLVRKVEAGADFLITQLFFDNADYFEFKTRARAAGIGVPIVPGIMPIASAANIRRITSMCGARIPAELEQRLDAVGHDDDATADLGVEWATAQCEELLDHGVPGIHFYTLNKSPATRQITQRLFGG
ncbi:MAG: methylenetetrahydrofolate reductase [NAD(P)H] [Myxococcota bacterium]